MSDVLVLQACGLYEKPQGRFDVGHAGVQMSDRSEKFGAVAVARLPIRGQEVAGDRLGSRRVRSPAGRGMVCMQLVAVV